MSKQVRPKHWNLFLKGEKNWLPAFSPLPTTFSKGFFAGLFNVRIVYRTQKKYCQFRKMSQMKWENTWEKVAIVSNKQFAPFLTIISKSFQPLR